MLMIAYNSECDDDEPPNDFPEEVAPHLPLPSDLDAESKSDDGLRI